MIAQELFRIWHHIIGALEQHLWCIVDDSEEFLPSLRVAISLDERQHETLLLRSGIKVNILGRQIDQKKSCLTQGVAMLHLLTVASGTKQTLLQKEQDGHLLFFIKFNSCR